MGDMISLLQNFQQYMPYFVIGLAVMVIVLAIILFILRSKLNDLTRRYQRMMQGMEGVNIERMMIGHIEEIRDAMITLEQLKAENKRLETLQQSCIQRVGLVRYNAFEDTGSDLSFSLALLDGKHNGLILSSLYGRKESRIYAKPVTNLQSKYALSAEEQAALRLAKDSAQAIKVESVQIQPKVEVVRKIGQENILVTAEEKDLLTGQTRK